MSCTSLLLLLLVACSFDCAYTITLRGQSRRRRGMTLPQAEVQPEKQVALSQTNASSVAMVAHREIPFSQTVLRPNAGKGVDKIEFGLTAKNFYGTNLKKNTFKVDIVMSVMWKDDRVIAMIPAAQKKMVMSTTQAEDMIWMPSVVITNRDIEMYEIISSSVTIFKSGDVLRVERAMVRVCDLFKLNEYPFDSQNLDIKIGSSKYMTNEVVLVPSTNEKVSGVAEKIWGDYYLLGWEQTVYEDIDGNLKKSRGMLKVHVKRGLEKYRQDHLVPAAILVVISWAVFYFPFVGPFITPRLVLSILALLTFTNLIIKSTSALPGAAPWNWNDLFNQQIQVLMFMTIVINVLTEILHHTLEVPDIAKRVNHEAKIVLPLMSAGNVVIILSAAYYEYLSLNTVTYITQAMVAILLGSYIYWIISITRAEIKAKEARESGKSLSLAAAAESQDADADAGDAGDAGV